LNVEPVPVLNSIGNEEKKESKKKNTRKKKAKPPKFQEMKKLAELVLSTQNISYEDWLHEKHQELISESIPSLIKTVEKAVDKGGDH